MDKALLGWCSQFNSRLLVFLKECFVHYSTTESMARELMLASGLMNNYHHQMVELCTARILYLCLQHFPLDQNANPWNPVWRMGAGAFAGVFATVLTYPMDVVRAKLTVQSQARKTYNGAQVFLSGGVAVLCTPYTVAGDFHSTQREDVSRSSPFSSL